MDFFRWDLACLKLSRLKNGNPHLFVKILLNKLTKLHKKFRYDILECRDVFNGFKDVIALKR